LWVNRAQQIGAGVRGKEQKKLDLSAATRDRQFSTGEDRPRQRVVQTGIGRGDGAPRRGVREGKRDYSNGFSGCRTSENGVRAAHNLGTFALKKIERGGGGHRGREVNLANSKRAKVNGLGRS